MKIEGKFIFKVAGTLTAISLVVALLLGLTNMLTADKIAAINKQKTEEALAKVVSAADCEFPPMEDIPQAMIDAANDQGGKLSEVYEVQSGGDTIGYAFKVTASGSQGNIVMIVGVDTDLTVTGVSIVNNSETKGIGSKVMDNEATSAGTGALDQFVGKSGAGTLVVKQNIDAVTGAILSSDRELENFQIWNNGTSRPSGNGSNSSSGDYITAERAQQIALAETPSGSTVVKCQFDWDDGRAQYDVEIRNGWTEYEFEIDAVTGTIFSRDIDNDRW